MGITQQYVIQKCHPSHSSGAWLRLNYDIVPCGGLSE
uniref:Uncharacterized protein n=1 Tax=Anguilla anguilla TaxID=7936 RepID=A0A0E9QX31_ANGAN